MACRRTNRCFEIHKGKGEAFPLHAKHAQKGGRGSYTHTHSWCWKELGGQPPLHPKERDLVPFVSEIYTKHIFDLFGQKVEFLHINP